MLGDTPPGGRLLRLVLQAAGPGRRYEGLDDSGVVVAAGRLAALESWLAAQKLAAIREIIRRRPAAGHEPGTGGGLPDLWQKDLAEELACELAVTRNAAGDLIELAWVLEARLPLTAAALDQGVLDVSKVRMIAAETSVLSDHDAGEAEKLVAPKWAGKTWGQLRRLVVLAVVNIDPEAAVKRREQAERDDARVRFWREHSGAAGLGGYGLPVERALKANAIVQARARDYRAWGIPGTLDQLRAQAYLDMLLCTDPRTQHPATGSDPAASHPESTAPGGTAPGGTGPGGAGSDGQETSPGCGSRDRIPCGRGSGTSHRAGDDQPGDGQPGDGQPGCDGTADYDPGDGQSWDYQPQDGQPRDEEPWETEPGDEARDNQPGVEQRDNQPGDGPRDNQPGDELTDYEPPDEPADGGLWDDPGDYPDDCDPDDGPDDGDPDDEPGGNGGGGPGGNGGGPGGGGPGGGPGNGGPGGGAVPDQGLAANVDLTIPLRDLTEHAQRAGEAHGLGVLDPGLARKLAAEAAKHPRSVFRIIITGPDGHAVGFGQATRIRKRKPGAEPPPAPGQDNPGDTRDGTAMPAATFIPADNGQDTLFPTPDTRFPTPDTSAGHRSPEPRAAPDDGNGSETATGDGRGTGGRVDTGGGRDRADTRNGPEAGSGWEAVVSGGRDTWILRIGDQAFSVRLLPIPAGECDHRYQSRGYQPSDTLRRLVQIRDGECTMPICIRHPRGCDWEHAVPWPAGPTCACNGGARCRHDHLIKQSPRWDLEQLPGGQHQWTTPSGLTYTKGPKEYPI